MTIDTSVQVGSLRLANPVMTASGTAGHGMEFAPYGDLSALGAFVAKSLAAYAWQGNPPPRVHPTPQGMINSVGLQGPGVAAWLRDDYPALEAAGVQVVASIWGRSVADYAAAATALATAGPAVIAVEVNLSCPNLEGRSGIFGHDARLSADVISASAVCGRPMWAKLSPNTDRLVEVAAAVQTAGADAVTLINTLLGMVVDQTSLRPVLGNGGGGLSGRAIHPVAVRCVFDVHSALPDLAVVGVGGVASGWDAVELIAAGASAVQVGTASFANPRAPWTVQSELIAWLRERGLSGVADLVGSAHQARE